MTPEQEKRVREAADEIHAVGKELRAKADWEYLGQEYGTRLGMSLNRYFAEWLLQHAAELHHFCERAKAAK